MPSGHRQHTETQRVSLSKCDTHYFEFCPNWAPNCCMGFSWRTQRKNTIFTSSWGYLVHRLSQDLIYVEMCMSSTIVNCFHVPFIFVPKAFTMMVSTRNRNTQRQVSRLLKRLWLKTIRSAWFEQATSRCSGTHYSLALLPTELRSVI
jgi:hypothetical protein